MIQALSSGTTSAESGCGKNIFANGTSTTEKIWAFGLEEALLVEKSLEYRFLLFGRRAVVFLSGFPAFLTGAQIDFLQSSKFGRILGSAAAVLETLAARYSSAHASTVPGARRQAKGQAVAP